MLWSFDQEANELYWGGLAQWAWSSVGIYDQIRTKAKGYVLSWNVSELAESQLGASLSSFGNEVMTAAAESWSPSGDSGAAGDATQIPHSIIFKYLTILGQSLITQKAFTKNTLILTSLLYFLLLIVFFHNTRRLSNIRK